MAVACLCPHNSISNVVASVTIDSWWHIYIYNFLKWIFVNVYEYVYVYVYVQVMYMYMFRDLESCLSKTKSVWTWKDGEPCLRRANAGGGLWRY